MSRCLLGDAVRYDGGHKRDDHVRGVLARHIEVVAVCPEVEAGFGVPREPMQLEGECDSPRLVALHTRRDVTEPMKTWSQTRVSELIELELDGFVLKSKSPSCGLEGVPVYEDAGISAGGRGLFASTLVAALPDLPVIEERALAEPRHREDFVARVLAHRDRRRASAAPRARRPDATGRDGTRRDAT